MSIKTGTWLRGLIHALEDSFDNNPYRVTSAGSVVEVVRQIDSYNASVKVIKAGIKADRDEVGEIFDVSLKYFGTYARNKGRE